jgi:DNA-binding YbaB/EbfC family protein
MGGPGGMGGFDVNALLKQAQQMQEEMVQAQESLKDEQVEASAGGGMVKVVMSGDLVVKSIAIDPEDAEMLAEMVQAAVNEAIRAAQELAASKMPDIPGMGGPGGPGIPGLPGA